MTPKRKKLLEEAAVQQQADMTVVLENVHDRHNISAVLRSCDSVGISEVHILYTIPELQKKKKVFMGKRTSAGTRKWIHVIRHHDRESCLSEIREKYNRVYGTMLGEKSQSLYDLELTKSVAFVFGNEHDGLTPETAALCDGQFHIPQFGFGKSLNISVACAISVYEAARQRLVAGMYHRSLSDPLSQAAYERLKDRYLMKSDGKRVTMRYE